VASAPAGSAGSTGAIDVVDLTDGAILQMIDGLFPQNMTIDEGLNRVYATVSPPTGPGHVAVIDATSGHLIRTVTVGRYPGQVVASARTGHAFVVNGQDGTVSMLDGRSGHVLRTIAVRPAQTHGLFDVEGTLSHLIALDERSGRVLIGNPSPYRFPSPRRCPFALRAIVAMACRHRGVTRIGLQEAPTKSAGRVNEVGWKWRLLHSST
jgi:hypothetical protein